MKFKKILLIIVFLIIVVILAWLLWSLFFKPTLPSAPPEKEVPTTTPIGKLPEAEEGVPEIIEEKKPDTILPFEEERRPDEKALGGITKTTLLGDAKSLNATLSGNGTDVQYYNQDDGKFYRVDEEGNITVLSDKVFHNVENVTWSPKKNKAIIEYPDGANIIYDFATAKQITLPKHWEDFDFSTDGNQIVMKSMGLDPANRWLAISNDDGSRSQPIEYIGENADIVHASWSPNNQSIAMYTQGIDFNRQEVFFVGLHGENFKSTVIEGRGFKHKWSETGDRLVYSVYSTDDDLKPKLWIVNAQGETIGSGRKSLDLETWASKCVFANNQDLYCGVPESLEKGAGMFPEMAKNTRDDLYHIDINTGQKRLIAIPDGFYNMTNLVITENEDNLFFTDATTGLIHKIELK